MGYDTIPGDHFHRPRALIIQTDGTGTDILRKPSEENSEIAKQAQQLGLDYLGFGRYGKNKKVTHTSQTGRLVPKQKN